jgi:hypothetical protein
MANTHLAIARLKASKQQAEKPSGGQVVGDLDGELYLAVFEEEYTRDDADPMSIVDGTPAFLLLSMDALFWHGQ